MGIFFTQQKNLKTCGLLILNGTEWVKETETSRICIYLKKDF